ncbi:MAG: hypothetical protein AB1393_08170 [Candidatus Edwardsbacteria bacterium]
MCHKRKSQIPKIANTTKFLEFHRVMSHLGLVVLLALFCFASLAQGQMKESASLISKSNEGLFRFFTPSRFSMSHSYTLSYSLANSKGQWQGLYLNQMSYRLSPSLLLEFDLATRFEPFKKTSQIQKSFVPYFSLQYQPNKNLFFKIDYRQTSLENNGYIFHR